MARKRSNAFTRSCDLIRQRPTFSNIKNHKPQVPPASPRYLRIELRSAILLSEKGEDARCVGCPAAIRKSRAVKLWKV